MMLSIPSTTVCWILFWRSTMAIMIICNKGNPITTLTGDDSYIILNRSKPFNFISGNKSKCDEGRRLTVVVILSKK
ncbi:hypothetical protein L6452_41249 [Arctium lappa]|uniref:Uncharacterized protein n=1 Tax=Arctium lappa TaxID=4217 RepID=A0ACB8XNW8_ARCLA|nr:hypothetical protein L6452_41249 [Arctium lappa]